MMEQTGTYFRLTTVLLQIEEVPLDLCLCRYMERTVTLLVKTNLTLVLTGSELRDFMSIHVVNVQKKDALYKALCVNVLQVANLIAHTLIAQLLAMNQFPVEAVHMFQEVVNTTRDWIVLKISLVRHVQKLSLIHI